MLWYAHLIFFFVLFEEKTVKANSDSRIIIAYDDLKSTADTFSDPGVSFFSELLINDNNEQQELIVGARDAIYRLAADNLQLLEKAEWKASKSKIVSCYEKGQAESDCKNYIKVLHIDGNKLFTCGTNAFSPICTWRALEKINTIISETSGIAKCPYSPYVNGTSLISEDLGVLFAGTTLDFTGTDTAIIRDGSDKLKFLRTTQYDSKWLNEPQFVGSFETDAFVYFLFREGAVEYINCGKVIYSRIARVCKKDPGDKRKPRESWTTFLKARLNCSLPGEYPFYFDEIQGVTYLPDNGMIYATFTTPRNSIPGSAICSFNLSAINAAFSGPYKHQRSMGSTWDSVTNDNIKQCQNSDMREIFISSMYQLMDNSVQPVTKIPLYYAQLERFVHITVDEIVAKRHREKTVLYVLYVSTEDNIIKKMSVLPPSMTTCVLEIWKPLSDHKDSILSMRYLKGKESLFIGTKNEIIRIPSQHCERHKSKQTCLDAKDPYCGWNEVVSQCTPAPDKNPLTFHWNQFVNECPVFMHPVPGGWSSWSSWTPCVQNDLKSRSSDKCMCSSRQCNNPSPQNGGPHCEGVNIQVVNCTVHGDWTDWSEWSACSQTCGKDAVKTRKRTCTNPSPAFGGRVCVGPESDMTICLENPPCPSTPPVISYSSWKAWNECSVKCGEGYQFRTREFINKLEGSVCLSNTIEYRKCNIRSCPTLSPKIESTPWQCTQNNTEIRFVLSCDIHNSTSLRLNVQREERNNFFNASCNDKCGSWSNWSKCNQFKMQERSRKCLNNMDSICQCIESEQRSCITFNEIHAIDDSGFISVERNNCMSTETLLLFCCLSYIIGICTCAILYCYKIKREQHLIPSSPLYATKQNFYVNVPLREPLTPKRTSSFSKNTVSSSSMPKVCTKSLTSNNVKPVEFDIATIKRNSNNLKNGYARTYKLDPDSDRFS